MRSFGVFTVIQRPSWRNAKSFPSSARSGKVDCSRSPRSGSRPTASSSSTQTPLLTQCGSRGAAHDLGAATGELLLEQSGLPRGAADDDPVDAGAHALRDLIRGEWMSGDRDERLRQPLSGLAHPGRPPAREDDRLHYDEKVESGDAAVRSGVS